MDLYVIVRRNGWASPQDLETAAGRSTAEGDKPGSGVRWIRSYEQRMVKAPARSLHAEAIGGAHAPP